MQRGKKLTSRVKVTTNLVSKRQWGSNSQPLDVSKVN